MSEHSTTPGKTPEQERRAVAAALRQEERDQRSPAEQLAELDHRPGDSVRERARLQKLIEKEA